MKKILLLAVTFITSLALYAQEERKEYDTELYRTRMIEFQMNPLEKGQIVFLGNSITQGGKWKEYFPNLNVANRGIIGDNTEGMLNRLDEIAASRPKKLFIMAGINDISQNATNRQIVFNIYQMVERIRYKSPDTKIYIQSVMPINNDFGRYKRLTDKEEQIEELNKELERFCKSRGDLTFIYTYPSFLIKKRQLDAKYTNDGLHLNDEGYAIWVSQLRKYVEN